MSNYIQNTPEWLEMRRNKIGASDAPIIMCVSPYKTAHQLFEEKLGLIQPTKQTANMTRGHDLEHRAREALEKILGLFLKPSVRFHPTIDYLVASLDCVDIEGKIIAEIKCPGQVDHQMAVNGKVPEKYFPQLQHQIEVCGLESSYYFSYDGSEGVLVKIFRDQAYINKMLEKEKIFWECLQDLTPPELTDRDHKERQDTEWAVAAGEFNVINTQMKQLEKRYQTAREKLISLANNQSSLGYGVRVSKILRKGNVDYQNIPELKTVNLEIYRKKTTQSWTIVQS